MAEREEFLGRVRQALGHHLGAPAPVPDAFPPLGPVLAPIPPGELVSHFEAELREVGGSTHRARTQEELEAILRGILEGARAARVVLTRNPLLAALHLAERLRRWGQSVDAWPAQKDSISPELRASYRESCFAVQMGITGVDFVLAESGTLVLTSLTEGSQLASLAPPVHVALYRRGQVVESLETVLARLPAPRPGEPATYRSVVLVTGTSRTADIEQILVRGVHGPGEVHAVLVEDSCLA